MLAELPVEVIENPVAYPPREVLAKTDFWKDLPPELNKAVDAAWTELLSSDEQYSKWLIPMMMAAGIAASVTINLARAYRRRRDREYTDSFPKKRM